MIKRLLKLSYAMVVVGFLFAQYASGMQTDDDLAVLVRLGYFAPAPPEPELSSDGMTLYNAGLPAVYVDDPSPSGEPVRIPPPFDLLSLPESATATFSITYVPNGGTDLWGEPCSTFPNEAKVAFDAAANIWANILQSSVAITISACWANLGSSSILGYSGGGPLQRDFSGAPLASTWYTGSLANALAGSDLNPGSFDMHITYNSNFTWYYGTDGLTPAGQHDLMSVVLHEIGHGLNFSGFMSYSGGTGSWGGGTGYPTIYDTFMRDGAGNQLINTGVYGNPSVALGSALTSDNIWFHGSNAMAANGGLRVKIYAPSTWSGGSSYSHLDYAAFNNTANQLMVYAISAGESVHDPGPVTKGLLKDLGWTIGSAPPTLDQSSLTVVRHSDNTLWAMTCEGTSNCSSWTQISGGFSVQPTLTWDPSIQKYILMGIGNDQASIWRGTFDPDGTWNNNWTKITGASPSPVALAGGGFNSPAPQSITNLTVVRHVDNTLWSMACEGTGTCSSWAQISGGFSVQPTLTWDPSIQKYILIGIGNNQTSIWRSTFDADGTWNNDWTKITGASPSPVAVAGGGFNSPSPQSITNLTVVRHVDNTLWSMACEGTGTCSLWTQISGGFSVQPTLTWDPSIQKYILMGIGNDQASIWRSTFDAEGTWNNDWTKLTGASPSPVAVAGGGF